MQRVRLTVETIDEPDTDREAAVARLKAGIASMHFFSEGQLPTREELRAHPEHRAPAAGDAVTQLNRLDTI